VQPDLLYVGTVAAIGMLHGMVRTIAPLYAVQAAGLQPLELALAGTLLELGSFWAKFRPACLPMCAAGGSP